MHHHECRCHSLQIQKPLIFKSVVFLAASNSGSFPKIGYHSGPQQILAYFPDKHLEVKDHDGPAESCNKNIQKRITQGSGILFNDMPPCQVGPDALGG